MAAGSRSEQRRRYHLPSIVAQLPHYTGPQLTCEKPTDCLELDVQAPKSYVWPDLYIEDLEDSASQGEINSPILLISAPGAMGKSIAARKVASELNAVLIDLSALSVGSDTLTGLLARVLGWTQAPKLINDLRSGKAAVVLDGLDEAQLRAGREHTMAFLNNVLELVSGCEKASGQVIIFGRREAIETSYLAFSEDGITAVTATIAPLTHVQSNELIGLELSGKTLNSKPFDIHKTHPIPFAELRDSLFREVASDLGATVADDGYWEEVGDFLGYPPVLLVFAERLAVENPSAELARSREDPGSTPRYTQHGDLLKKIVEGILDRESQKVRTQLSQRLSLTPGDPKTGILYTREEQSLRILKYVSGRTSIDLLPPAGLSNDDRATYEELLADFVRDHPFLNERGQFANVVFSDYVRAFVATAPLVGVHGPSRAEILHACPLPGPFFTDIVHSLAQKWTPPSSANEDPSIAILDNEELVDDLIRSYSAGSFDESHFIYSQTANQCFLVLYQGQRTDASRSANHNISFRIVNPSGVLELTSPLPRGTIVATRSGVVLHSISDEVELGPNLTIFADSLQIKARRLIAIGSRDPETVSNVFIFAKEIDHEAILTINAYPHSALQVVSTGALWHMWRPYSSPIDPSGFASISVSNPATAYEIAIGIRRIFMSFRHTDMTGDPSIHYGWVDRIATGSNPIFNAVLSGLIELKIVEREGFYYRLRLNKLNGYGLSYVSLRGSDFAESLKGLATELSKLKVVKDALQQSEKGED